MLHCFSAHRISPLCTKAPLARNAGIIAKIRPSRMDERDKPRALQKLFRVCWMRLRCGTIWWRLSVVLCSAAAECLKVLGKGLAALRPEDGMAALTAISELSRTVWGPGRGRRGPAAKRPCSRPSRCSIRWLRTAYSLGASVRRGERRVRDRLRVDTPRRRRRHGEESGGENMASRKRGNAN